jgi:sialic acid synthase SpsE
MKSISLNFTSKKIYFITEISANHNGSLKQAKKIIYTAKKYGADAVKLKTYTPDTMTIKSNKLDRKRSLIDQKLDIFKNIKSQINLFRIANNHKWPCYFEFKKKKYKSLIFKDDKKDFKKK